MALFKSRPVAAQGRGQSTQQPASKLRRYSFLLCLSLVALVLTVVLELQFSLGASLKKHAMHYALSSSKLGVSTKASSGVAATRVFRARHNSSSTKRSQPPTPDTVGCNQDLCSVAGPHHLSAARPRTSVVTNAAPNVNAVATSEPETKKKWWKANADLWEEVHDEASFNAAVSTGDKLVLVGRFSHIPAVTHPRLSRAQHVHTADFFATWCHGCEKAYPELCKLAQDKDIQKQFKFVKVTHSWPRLPHPFAENPRCCCTLSDATALVCCPPTSHHIHHCMAGVCRSVADAIQAGEHQSSAHGPNLQAGAWGLGWDRRTNVQSPQPPSQPPSHHPQPGHGVQGECASHHSRCCKPHRSCLTG
jgi:thiol-disulfide isomerase/thioredoxin